MALRGVSGLFQVVVGLVEWFCSVFASCFKDSPARPVIVEKKPELEERFEHAVAPELTLPELIERVLLSGATDLVLDEIQLNSQLCKRLEKRLAKARSVLKRYHADVGKPKTEALRELSFVLKRGDDLIRKCLCEDTPWLYVAVTMADIKEDVLEIELDLFWWRNVLKLLCANASDSDSDDVDYIERALDEHKTLYDKLSRKQNSLFQTARDDMQQLKTKLERVQAKHAEPRSDEYYLSLYLLSRLNDNKFPEVARILDQHFHDLDRGDVLGSGTQGTVFKVTWLKRFEWALKWFHHFYVGLSDSESPALNKEGRIMKSCNHPHIVQCMWFWEKESALKNGTKNSGILMELMPENLYDHIQRQTKVKGRPPFALHVAIDIALQIAKAMRYLHRMKITHRDLKPSNVLVMPRSDGSAYLQVKLTDFGISKHYNGTQTSSEQTPKMGTPIYAAPEVFITRSGTGNKDEDVVAPKFPPKADVWSFAMTFSEILTGQSPFHHVKIKSRIHLRIRDEVLRPALPENLPFELHSCITKCWSLSPDVRPNFATICRDLHRAKALSLEILHSSPLSSQRRLDASFSVNDSVMDSITGFEIGQKYILIGTNFKCYTDASKNMEIFPYWKIPSTGIEDPNSEHPQASLESLKPIHRVIMEGLFWAKTLPSGRFVYGCLTGVFVNSMYEANLRTMNVRFVEGGYLEETDSNSREPRVEKYLWGAQTSDRGRNVAEFYCLGEPTHRYVYVYLKYGSSKAAVISHLWHDNILVLGDKSTAHSASKDAIVMGSKVLVSMGGNHFTTIVALSPEAS